MASRNCAPMKSSSASFSRCAACEYSSPYAARPKPISATAMRRPTYVKPPVRLRLTTPLSGGRATTPGSRTRRTNGAGAAGFAGRRPKNAGFESRVRSVALIALGAALHIPDVALARVLRRHSDPCRGALRERILRDRAQVVLGDEVLERGGVLAGIGIVLVERVAHQREVLLKHRFFGPAHLAHVIGHDDRQQKRDDRENDHQFDESKAFVFAHHHCL